MPYLLRYILRSMNGRWTTFGQMIHARRCCDVTDEALSQAHGAPGRKCLLSVLRHIVGRAVPKSGGAGDAASVLLDRSRTPALFQFLATVVTHCRVAFFAMAPRNP